MVGRWFGKMAHGQFVQVAMSEAVPVKGELARPRHVRDQTATRPVLADSGVRESNTSLAAAMPGASLIRRDVAVIVGGFPKLAEAISSRQSMSPLGHEQTSRNVRLMSVIPLKADVHLLSA
jgi:hypothetical protein